jgi:hydroxyacylglutathione hydrolase
MSKSVLHERTRPAAISRAFIFALLVCVFASASFAETDKEYPVHITPQQLYKRIQQGEAPVIVDVRTRFEFEAGHVPGAVHMPFWSVLWRSSQLAASPDEPVVVYCAHGPRAGLARAALRLKGFNEVLYLEGHMSAWSKAGLPQEKPPAER